MESKVSKADLGKAIESIRKLFESSTNSADLIPIALPIRYWIVILAILEPVIKQRNTFLEKMREEGTTMTDVNEMELAQRSAIIGPLMIRGNIVDVLVERGVMKPDAALRLGAGSLVNIAAKVLEKNEKLR